MPMPDPASIGAERQYKTPEEAAAQTCGVYSDAAQNMAPAAKSLAASMPQAPDPTDLASVRIAGTGGR